jgi:type II secretory pathway predicted ATPase ExeA
VTRVSWPAAHQTRSPATCRRGRRGGYLTHHLKLVGRADQLFSDDAAALIHQTSRGLPRVVNNIALQALVATYAANKTIVDESAARAAVAEVTAD